MEAARIIERQTDGGTELRVAAAAACGARSPAGGRRTRSSSSARGARRHADAARAGGAAAGRARARAGLRRGRRRARGGAARRAERRGRAVGRRARDDGDRARPRRGARPRATCSTRELDLEQIDEPDASYDVVFCREGLMLVPDPARAAREIRRVLRRAAASRSPCGARASRTRGSASCSTRSRAQLGIPMPPPGPPGPVLALRRRRSSPRCSPTPASPTWRSRRSARRTAPRRRRSGGRGRPRSPARSRSGWRRCPSPRAQALFARARERDQRLRDAGRAGDPGRVADRRRARA